MSAIHYQLCPSQFMSIITLLTDFGSQDYFVSAMKGVILSINPDATIVDITHEIPPQDLQTGAFNLLAAYKDFSPGTIHIAVIDPGVGSTRKGIVIDCAGQFFVGPDNGLFSWICDREQSFRAFELSEEKFFRRPVSRTFHGRDIFAPVAAALANGVAVEEFGPRLEKLVRLKSLAPVKCDGGSLEAIIVHIDRFGNCITNLAREHIGAGARLIFNGREIAGTRAFFSDGSDGEASDDELFCFLGSAGFIEIAVQNSSAAEVLNAKRGDRVIVLSTAD
jgi:S-adenosylmethionine hydrolase